MNAGSSPRGAAPDGADRRRTALVTGANTGIGRATATELARRGHRVVLACRSAQRAAPVAREVATLAGPDGVDVVELDLADLDQVRRAAAALLERGEPLDVLVANAGLAGQRGTTRQGFELAFGTNHLGHHLFVTSLLPLLRDGGPTDPARVVVVASGSHYEARGIDWDRVRRPTRSITGLPEYAVSKLANVCFAQELARRVDPERVWVGSLHPGTIATDVWRRIPGPVRSVMTRRMPGPEDGARTSVWCATAQEPLGHHGGYFDDRRPKEPSAVATPGLGAELWRRSEEWCAT